jgi:hypothetical protein
MPPVPPGSKSAHWRLPLVVLGIALVLGFLSITIDDNDGAQLLLFFGIIPSLLATLVLLAYRKKGRHRRDIAILLMLSFGLAWLIGRDFLEARTIARWMRYSTTYKARTFAHAVTPGGYLKHSEWDGWGFPGAGNTVMYVVFDANDTLSAQVHGKTSGPFTGIPCPVADIKRMEDQWYIVLFYTGSDWNHCSP